MLQSDGTRGPGHSPPTRCETEKDPLNARTQGIHVNQPQKTTAVLSYLEARKSELVEFAGRLVAAPSVNPPGNEYDVARVILKEMEALGLEGTRVAGAASERPNLIYRQRGAVGYPRLILNGHMDTKPVGREDRKLWNTDPLKPTIQDGKLYGLGAADMKGALAAILYAAAALRALDALVCGDLLVVLTADEEAGAALGAKWLVDHHELEADFCLVAEPCGLKEDFESITVAGRNIAKFMTKVHGTQMHSSISDIFPSVNASAKMAWVLWRMATDLELTFEPHPFYPQGPTVSIGSFVSGGVYYGVYPGYAEFASDIRLIPGMTIESVQADVEAFLSRLRNEDPELTVELEFEDSGKQRSWNGLRGDEPFLEMLQRASQRVLGRRLPLTGFPAFTDAYWFETHLGIPSIPAFGPGLLPLAHGPNEYVATEAIAQASKMYALAALAYLDGNCEANDR
jgi:acetylornithine deacetylase/succinyl-diaminopimelate desuccinylase-like protein